MVSSNATVLPQNSKNILFPNILQPFFLAVKACLLIDNELLVNGHQS
jgi:hypothetical protein